MRKGGLKIFLDAVWFGHFLDQKWFLSVCFSTLDSPFIVFFFLNL